MLSQRVLAINKKLLNEALFGKIYSYKNPDLTELRTPEDNYWDCFCNVPIPNLFEIDSVRIFNVCDSGIYDNIQIVYQTLKGENNSFVSRPFSIGVGTYSRDYLWAGINGLTVYWIDVKEANKILSESENAFLSQYINWKFADKKNSKEDSYPQPEIENWEFWTKRDLMLVGGGWNPTVRLGYYLDSNIRREILTKLQAIDLTLVNQAGKKAKIDEEFQAKFCLRCEIRSVQNPDNPDDPTDAMDTIVCMAKRLADGFKVVKDSVGFHGEVTLINDKSMYFRNASYTSETFLISELELKRILNPKVFEMVKVAANAVY